MFIQKRLAIPIKDSNHKKQALITFFFLAPSSSCGCLSLHLFRHTRFQMSVFHCPGFFKCFNAQQRIFSFSVSCSAADSVNIETYSMFDICCVRGWMFFTLSAACYFFAPFIGFFRFVSSLNQWSVKDTAAIHSLSTHTYTYIYTIIIGTTFSTRTLFSLFLFSAFRTMNRQWQTTTLFIYLRKKKKIVRERDSQGQKQKESPTGWTMLIYISLFHRIDACCVYTTSIVWKWKIETQL